MTYQEYKEKITKILYQTSRDWGKELKHDGWKDVSEKIKNYWLKQAEPFLSLFYKPCDSPFCNKGRTNYPVRTGAIDYQCSNCKGEGYIKL